MSYKNPNIMVLRNLVCKAREYFGEQTIISGGAPRDILSGAPVKDIDIFCRIEESDEASNQFKCDCENFAREIRGKLVWRPVDPSYTEHFDLADIEFPEGPAIQVIALYIDPIDDVHQYDFSISKVFVTPSGIFQTPEAVADRANKVITYTEDPERGTDGLIRSIARMDRLKVKYPDWKFENTEILEAARKIYCPTDEQLKVMCAAVPPYQGSVVKEQTPAS